MDHDDEEQRLVWRKGSSRRRAPVDALPLGPGVTVVTVPPGTSGSGVVVIAGAGAGVGLGLGTGEGTGAWVGVKALPGAL